MNYISISEYLEAVTELFYPNNELSTSIIFKIYSGEITDQSPEIRWTIRILNDFSEEIKNSNELWKEIKEYVQMKMDFWADYLYEYVKKEGKYI